MECTRRGLDRREWSRHGGRSSCPCTRQTRTGSPNRSSIPTADSPATRTARCRWRGIAELGRMTSPIHIGFVALTDCAPLVVAREAGFFQEQGLEVELERQISWEHAERRLIDGTLQASHVLATLPLRATLALSETPAPLCTAWVLCRGGNAITASNTFWKKCQGGLAGMIQGGESPCRCDWG